jgi:hypothetical protein
MKKTVKMKMMMVKAMAGRCTVYFQPDVMSSSPLRGKGCVHLFDVHC